MPVDGMAAARTLQTFAPLARHGACLFYVWQAYDAHGADTQRIARTALEAWNKSEGQHPGDALPPPGVPIYLGVRKRDGNRDGDVFISIGDGKAVATDQPTWGKVSVCTIAERMAVTGREYLGWAECIFDAPISFPAPASSADASPAPKVTRRKDPNMPILSVSTDRPDKQKLYWLAGDNGIIMQWTGEGYARAVEAQIGAPAAPCRDVLREQVVDRFKQQDVRIINADEVGTTVNVNAG